MSQSMIIPKSLKGWVKAPLRCTRNVITALSYYGKGRYCPVCGKSSGRFRPFGIVPREDAQCVHCSALERHRLVWLFFQKNTNLFDGKQKKMLHIAPEQCFESIFKKRLGSNYLTVNIVTLSENYTLTQIPCQLMREL